MKPFILLISSVVLAGCVAPHSTIQSYRIDHPAVCGQDNTPPCGTPGEDAIEAITYRLPKTMVTIRGGQCVGPAKSEACKPGDLSSPYGLEFTTTIVADESATYIAYVDLNDWVETDFDLKTDANGLLSTSNSVLKSATRQALVDVANLAGTISGLSGISTMSAAEASSGFISKIRQVPGVQFDPERHVLLPFSVSCDSAAIFAGECKIAVAAAGREYAFETFVGSRAAPAGLDPKYEGTTRRECTAPATGVTCREAVKSRAAKDGTSLVIVDDIQRTQTYIAPSTPVVLSFSAPQPVFTTTPVAGVGLAYRRPVDTALSVSVQGAAPFMSTTVSIVDPDMVFYVAPYRRGFTNTDAKLAFSSGILTQYDGNYPSPGGQIASLPKDMITNFFTGVKDLLTLRVDVQTKETSLVQQQTALIEAQTKLREAEASAAAAKTGAGEND